MKKDDLTADDYRALAEFRHQIRRFLHFSERVARSEGLSPQQHQLLLALKGTPEGLQLSISDVAERLRIRHHSAVELTNRLAASGLIRKRQDPDDRRRVRLEVTARGESILRKLSLTHRAELQTVGRDLIHAVQNLITNNEGPDERIRPRKKYFKRTR